MDLPGNATPEGRTHPMTRVQAQRRLMARSVAGVLVLVVGACGSTASSAQPGRPTQAATPSISPATGVLVSKPSASPAAFATGCGDGLPDLSGPLTGSWLGDDGGVYYLRQAGACLWWFGTNLTEVEEMGRQPGWANVAVGRIAEDLIYIEWSDVPLGDTLGRGTLTLRLSDTRDRIEKVDEAWAGMFGATSWERIKPKPSPSQP